MPGSASGHSTRRNMVAGGAPRLKAASSTARSMPSITLCSVSTMKGRLTAMMPMITAFSVNMISSGVVDHAEAHQARIDEALVAEHHHPAGRAHRVADEQRQHDRA